MPAEVLARQQRQEQTWKCSYCGFVWFQKSSAMPGFDPVPAGFYHNFRFPDVEFQPVPATYRIKEQNTPHYWRDYREKLNHRRELRRRRGR